MKEVYAFLADGLEEVECLAAADVMVRAGIKVTLVSITGKKKVKGSHGFKLKADVLLEDADLSKADVLFLPGGMPGTTHLKEHEGLSKVLAEYERSGKYLAAICAAPSVFGYYGMLHGKRAVCYPGFEEQLTGAEITDKRVVRDGQFITSKGLGTAIDFSLELITLLEGGAVAEKVAKGVQYR